MVKRDALRLILAGCVVGSVALVGCFGGENGVNPDGSPAVPPPSSVAPIVIPPANPYDPGANPVAPTGDESPTSSEPGTDRNKLIQATGDPTAPL